MLVNSLIKLQLKTDKNIFSFYSNQVNKFFYKNKINIFNKHSQTNKLFRQFIW